MTATVVITTRNRRQDLSVALRSALQQTARPEVLVIDDGSTDGTAEMVAADFPSVRLHRSQVSRGYIVQRNLAATLATGEVIFSIDDDAAFSSPNIVEQTLADFDHPRIGAVAIPYLNVNSDTLGGPAASGERIICATAFIGTAHAVRRRLFLQLHGYPESLFHQGEENDLCIRMLNAGYVVRLGRSEPVHHFESQQRDMRRLDLYGRRNDVLYAWYNVPWPYLPVHLFGTTASGMRLGFKFGRPLRMVQGLALGYGAILRNLRHRRPVRPAIYRLSRALRRQPLPLDEIEAALPKPIAIAP